MLLVWLIAMSAVLFWWRFTDFGAFDSQSIWLDGSPTHLNGDVQGRVMYHVRGDCLCGQLADQHVALLPKESSYEQREVSVQEMQAMGMPVPATPMLVVANNGEVVYAGPYASGPSCSPENSFIPLITSTNSQITTPWYNGATNACRCTVIQRLK